jgi:hypothetical protein
VTESTSGPTEYTEAEQEALARRLHDLHWRVERGIDHDEPLSVDYVCSLHRALFDDIREHAGQLRRPGYGSEHLTFGPNRSVDRKVVRETLERVLERTRRSVASALENPDDPSYMESALHIAVWCHAEIVRSPPFRGRQRANLSPGSRRDTRAAGLHPIPIETARQTYCDCLNTFFDTNEIQPLLDLYLRLAAEQLA